MEEIPFYGQGMNSEGHTFHKEKHLSSTSARQKAFLGTFTIFQN